MSGHPMRQFESGATRNVETDQPDYEGFLSPLVLEAFGRYMHRHRKQADGQLRASDNWQKGIPLASYMKSGWRHFMDWWRAHRGLPCRDGLEDALCGLLFNVGGYLHETLKAKRAGPVQMSGDNWPYDHPKFAGVMREIRERREQASVAEGVADSKQGDGGID